MLAPNMATNLSHAMAVYRYGEGPGPGGSGRGAIGLYYNMYALLYLPTHAALHVSYECVAPTAAMHAELLGAQQGAALTTVRS